MIIKKQRQCLFFFILTALTMGAIVFSQNNQVFASDNQYITNVKLTDYTNPKANGNYDQHDSMKVEYTFKIPTGSLSENNKTFDAVLPEQFTLTRDVQFEIKSSDGSKTLGEAVADPTTNTIHVTMADDVVNDNATRDVSGSMWFLANWNMEKVDAGVQVPIHWNIPGSDNIKPGETVVVINPDNGPGKDQVLTKFGVYDPRDPTLIRWTVIVNAGCEHVDNAVVTDESLNNQKLVNEAIYPFVILRGDYENGKFKAKGSVDSSNIIRDSDTKFHVNLGNIDDTYQIYYYTRITDNGKANKYGNKVDLTGSNFQKKELTVWTADYAGGGTADNGKTSVSGKKTWNDNNNQDKIRPDSITVHLLANGKVVKTTTVTAADNWEYTFDDLPKSDNGEEITYTVSEDPVSGYSSSINGFDITNTHVPGTPSVPNTPNTPSTPTPAPAPGKKNVLPATGGDEPASESTPAQEQKTSVLPATAKQASSTAILGLIFTLASASAAVFITRKH
ncbi:Cna B-type domain-containing protein [Fructobacillus durionis]|uniref:Collagen binding domain-containing protein n=1 Tax=Fructobacillus durionis TaxID=283737 RepID=A0A1I1H1Y9_9LACO|nr:Cna B-type domain-containing protein [Fructobacillus durionis]SFC17934.1 Collagen binding domain-containing protein [Fructobacillus durionis]